MAENTKIEWATHTFNPWRGCTKVSAGCANCYADTQAKRNPGTLGVWGPNGTRVVASEAMWREPLKWNEAAAKAGERHRVFCASMADVFEDWAGKVFTSKGVPFWWCGGSLSNTAIPAGQEKGWGFTRWATMDDIRERLFHLIKDTPCLDWLLLTKRPENVLKMTHDAWCHPVPGHVSQNEGDGRRWKYPPNVWLGTSVEDQKAADERIPHLLKVPAAVRFLSCEPLLGPVDLGLEQYESPGWFAHRHELIHWVIVGGESGHGARPMHPDWVRFLRNQCQAAGVAFHFKQWGEYGDGYAGMPRCEAHQFRQVGMNGREPIVYRIGKKTAGRVLDGRTWDELPPADPATRVTLATGTD